MSTVNSILVLLSRLIATSMPSASNLVFTRMWANAQRDGCPAEYR